MLLVVAPACIYNLSILPDTVLHQHEVEAVLEARRQLTAAQDAQDTCEAELEFVEGDLATTGYAQVGPSTPAPTHPLTFKMTGTLYIPLSHVHNNCVVLLRFAIKR
jgi:hypothetical protein